MYCIIFSLKLSLPPSCDLHTCTTADSSSEFLCSTIFNQIYKVFVCGSSLVSWSCHGTIQQDADQHNSRESSNKNNDVYQYHIVVCCVPPVKLRVTVTRTFRAKLSELLLQGKYIFNFTRKAQVACLHEKDKL